MKPRSSEAPLDTARFATHGGATAASALAAPALLGAIEAHAMRGMESLNALEAIGFGAGRGLALGLLAAVAALVACAAQRSGVKARILTLCIVLVSMIALIAAGQHRVAARDESSLAFFALATCAGLTMLLWFGAWLRGRSALILLLPAVAALLVDPERLRGTYRSLDAGFLGLATAFTALAWSRGLKRLERGIIVTAIIATALFGLLASERTRALLVLRSPRLAALERVLSPLVPTRATTSIEAQPALPQPLQDSVFAQARERWRALRGDDRRALDLLWITVDTVRADATLLHGGRDTPEIDQWAAGAFRFRRAFAQAPGTLLSMESFLTGKAPSASGVARLWHGGTEQEAATPTIAGLLRARGYETIYLTDLTADQLREPTFQRLPRDFDQVLPRAGGEVSAAALIDRALALLQTKTERPRFLWVHAFDPHAPYVPREGVPSSASLRERWQGEVRFADRAVGRLLRDQATSGRAAHTIEIVHSDHGEEFGEHGRWYHASSYRDVQIRIPLYLRAPPLAGAVIDTPVGNIDLLPTLCSLLDLTPPADLHGHDLLPVMLDPNLAWPHYTYADTLVVDEDPRWPGDRQRMITDGRMKLIISETDGTQALFDLDADPLEQRNLVFDRPEDRQRLQSWIAGKALILKRGRGEADLLLRHQARLSRLREQKLPERQAELLQLVATHDHDALRRLEQDIAELDDATAHALLVALQTYSPPREPRKTPHPARPNAAPQTSFRMRLARALDPHPADRAASQELARNPFEAHADLLYAASQGDQFALGRLKTLGATTDGWPLLAVIGTRGGDAEFGEILRAFSFSQGLHGGSAGEAGFLRAFDLFGSQQPLLSAQWLLALLPDAKAGLHPRTVHRIMAEALRWPAPADAIAATALLPLLDPETALPRWNPASPDPQALRSVGSALLRARTVSAPMERRIAYAEVSTRARALGLEDRLSIAFESASDASPPALALQLVGDPSARAWLRLALQNQGPAPIDLGPRGQFRALRATWHASHAATPHARAVAGTEPLPPIRLLPGTSIELPLRLDLSTREPEAQLRFQLLARDGVAPLALETPASLAAWPESPLQGPALARSIRAPFSWVLEAGAGIEVLHGSRVVVGLPPIALRSAIQELRLSLRVYSAYAVQSAPALEGLPQGDLSLEPRADGGMDLVLRVKAHEPRVYAPQLVLPPEGGLWILESMELR